MNDCVMCIHVIFPLHLGSEKDEKIDKNRKTRVIEEMINGIVSTMEKSKPDFAQCYRCYLPLRRIASLKNKLMMNVKKGEAMNVEHE